MKKNIARRTKKFDTTMKIFFLCFVVYFVCNSYQK